MLMTMLLAAVIVQASSKNAPGKLYSLSTLSLVFIYYVDYDDAHGDVLDDAHGDVLNDAHGDVLNDAHGDVLNDAHGDAYVVVVARSHGPSIF